MRFMHIADVLVLRRITDIHGRRRAERSCGKDFADALQMRMKKKWIFC